MQGVGYLVTLSIEISLFLQLSLVVIKQLGSPSLEVNNCAFSVSPLARWSLQGHSVPTSEKPY